MIKYFPVIKASYEASDAVQQRLCRQLLDFKKFNSSSPIKAPSMAMLGYEMEPSYTFGRRQRGNLPTNLIDHLQTNCRGAKVVETLRGGFATFHGPGQLVLYPVVDLQRLGIKIRDYVCILEKSIISMLENRYNIAAEQRPGAGFNGVWIQNEQKKVASVGVHVRRNVTSHGLALNVDMDPFWFQQIVPCNLSEVEMTSMANHIHTLPDTGIQHHRYHHQSSNRPLEVATVGEELAQEIARRLGVDLDIQTIQDSQNLLMG